MDADEVTKPEQMVVNGGMHGWCSSARFPSSPGVTDESCLFPRLGMHPAVAMSWKLGGLDNR